jgi:PleD family two-component response regulator
VALGALRTEPFDLVLLDVLMPELDGYETLARIERDEHVRHVPVIMVSALEDIESVVRCIEMGGRTISRSRSTPSFCARASTAA